LPFSRRGLNGTFKEYLLGSAVFSVLCSRLDDLLDPRLRGSRTMICALKEDFCERRYPCGDHPALMMYSPTGIFSSYAVEREVMGSVMLSLLQYRCCCGPHIKQTAFRLCSMQMASALRMVRPNGQLTCLLQAPVHQVPGSCRSSCSLLFLVKVHRMEDFGEAISHLCRHSPCDIQIPCSTFKRIHPETADGQIRSSGSRIFVRGLPTLGASL